MDRRESPRVDVDLDIRFDGEQPYGWQGSKIVDLSLSGAKVVLPTTAIQPSWGTSVSLRLPLPDGQPPLSVKGIVWRWEPKGVVVLFVGLSHDSERDESAWAGAAKPKIGQVVKK